MAEKGGGDDEGVFVGLHFPCCVFDEQDCNTGSLDMEGITPPLVPVAFFSICVYSTFQNGFFCVSGHEILKIFVYFTWEHQKVAVLGSFCVTLCHISSGQIGFFKT